MQTSLTKRNTVVIIMEGGLIQDMTVPETINVLVKDYDVEGVDENETRLDAQGHAFTLKAWGAVSREMDRVERKPNSVALSDVIWKTIGTRLKEWGFAA